MLSQLCKAYSPVTSRTHYDNSLHDYVTKRKLLQRQKSIDEQEVSSVDSVDEVCCDMDKSNDDDDDDKDADAVSNDDNDNERMT